LGDDEHSVGALAPYRGDPALGEGVRPGRLGHEKHDPAGSPNGNVRNGTRPKTVLTEANGHVQIEVPRARAGTFAPQIVRKRQRRLTGVDEMVLSLYVKGLTTGEISAHFAEVYGASVSKETVSRITDKVIEEMNYWAHRPLERGSFDRR
jgi:transposase-like protein